jgi:hypothetical protein
MGQACAVESKTALAWINGQGSANQAGSDSVASNEQAVTGSAEEPDFESICRNENFLTFCVYSESCRDADNIKEAISRLRSLTEDDAAEERRAYVRALKSNVSSNEWPDYCQCIFV